MSEDLFDARVRRKLFLKRGREGALKNRHPWIFEGAIARESGPDDAAIADLYDPTGKLLASGLYSAASQIRLRALTFGEEVTFEEIRRRLDVAIDRRATLLTSGTSAVRLVHSEGDDLSGLVVDHYGDVLVVEITSAGLELLRDAISDELMQRTGARGIFYKNEVPARRLEGLTLRNDRRGDVPDPVEIVENGRRFLVSLAEGQKTGFFLDQRENRQIVGQISAGLSVLNVFSYSGGFGVYAATGGAAAVEEVDISEPAVEMARRNHELNPSGADLRFTAGDAFDYLRQIGREGRTFDVVICDPPAFAKTRHEVERAARGYKDINMQALRLVRPGGSLLTFSCSGHMSLDLFQKVVFSAALDLRRRVSLLRRLGAGADHPVSLFCPESEYLKGFWLRAE